MITKEQLHPDDQVNWPGFVSYICGKWEIARRYKPKRILEIGVRTGYAAWAFLQAHPEAKYVGIDNYSYGDYSEWAKENLLKDYNVSILRGDTQKTRYLWYDGNLLLSDDGIKDVEFPERFNFEDNFDFIHVDGDHSVAGVIHDLDLAIGALSENGVILIDDYDRIPEVKEGVDVWLKVNPDLDWKYCESFTGDILIGNVKYCLSDSAESETQANLTPKDEIQVQEDRGTLLVFHHGLGDLLLFLPLFRFLQGIGKYNIALQAGCDFTSLVDGSVETPAGEYDYKQYCLDNNYTTYKIVQFDMSENSGKTKTALCAEKEFGFLNFNVSVPVSDCKPLKLIGVSFHGTCLPGLTNPDERTAELIWNEVKEAGCVPFEIQFEHIFHNHENKMFPFIKENETTRSLKPKPSTLLLSLDNCFAFIGVASGNWVAAMTQIEKDKVACLQKAYHPDNYIDSYPADNIIDINNYQPGSVKRWLERFE